MKGTPVKNLRRTNNPITISPPDGSKVTSTHICDIKIPGLPMVLTGHIVPGITIASLIGIRILCKAGCKVIFDNEKCKVFYENNIILRGYKDPTTNLWTLPINNEEIAKTTPELVMLRPQSAHMMLSHQLPIQPQPGSCCLGLQYPAERYVGIQDCHIRDWQPARQPTIPSSDAEGNREVTCI
jgi:hypothetical protein